MGFFPGRTFKWKVDMWPRNNYNNGVLLIVFLHLSILLFGVLCESPNHIGGDDDDFSSEYADDGNIMIRDGEDSSGGDGMGSSRGVEMSVEQKNTLSIVPVSKNRVYQRALGKSSIFTCTATVENPERLNDFRWWWPDGRAIEATDSSEGFYDETRVEIMKNEAGSLTLLFPGIQEQDLGTYRCTAIYDNAIQLKTDFTLRAYVPITFEDAPINQYAVKGQDYRVRCRVRADPEPQVDWKKDHRVLNDSDHLIVQKDGVVIRSVSHEDEGVYTCRVRVTSMGTVEERHILVEVHERPQLTSIPDKRIEGVESESISLVCTAIGKPPPEYEWVNEKGEDLRVWGNERYTVDKYKGTLQIDKITREDMGRFQCTAKNAAGYVTLERSLIVVTKPVIVEFNNITAQSSGNTILTCKASGDPAPDIKFFKAGNRQDFTLGPQSDSTRIFMDQLKDDGGLTIATLKISDVSRVDDGLYSCTAYNQRTQVKQWGHITVQYPPTFVNTPMREAWSWDRRPVNLSCLAEAIPNATITWFVERDGNDLAVDQYTQNMKQIGIHSRSLLQISPINHGMYGTYKCKAVNKLGNAEHRVHLRYAKKPGPMLEAIVHEKTATTLAYKLVGPVEDGGLPIKSFLAQFKREEDGMGDSWVQHRLKTWPVDRQIFVIDGLQPQTSYVVRFAAENEVGLGDWALEKPEQTPRRSAPDSPMILNEVVGDYAITAYPDRFMLIWKLPPDNGERIEGFEISYEPVRNISVMRRGILVPQLEWEVVGQKLVEFRLYPGQPRHTLRNLAPDTFYRVQLRAKNQIGSSPPDSIVFKTATVPGEAWIPLRSPVTAGTSPIYSQSLLITICLLIHINIIISASSLLSSIFFKIPLSINTALWRDLS